MALKSLVLLGIVNNEWLPEKQRAFAGALRYRKNGNHLFHEIPSEDKTMADFMLDVQLWKNGAN